MARPNAQKTMLGNLGLVGCGERKAVKMGENCERRISDGAEFCDSLELAEFIPEELDEDSWRWVF